MGVLRRWRDAENDPVEEIGIGTVEERFVPVQLGSIEPREGEFGERAEYEIALLCPAVP